MVDEPVYLVCGPIERMVFPLFKKFNCCECGMEIGAGESSLKAMGDKKFDPICEECFVATMPDEIIVARPTEEQLNELRTKYPDFGEKEIRDTFERISKLSGKKVELR